MQLTTVIVTRNVAISVKTLHTLLKLNLICLQKNIANELVFVRDDPFEKYDILMKKLKHCDRLLWIEYSLFVDETSLVKMVEPLFKGYQCLVLPCVTEGINWDMFKKKVRDGSTEPESQMGLDFDTEVSQKLADDLYMVTKTTPKAWALDAKQVLRAFKDKKGDAVKIPVRAAEMFEKFIERGVKVCAFTGANLVATYPHECLGNILETAGVKVG
jgi:hypothetical protein